MMTWIILTGRSGVVFAVKLYPAGATTNSQDGVTDLFGKCLPVLEEMVEQNMPLLVFYFIKLTFDLSPWIMCVFLLFQLITTFENVCDFESSFLTTETENMSESALSMFQS